MEQTIITDLGTFHRAAETKEFIYYCNYEEGDENGNTLMYGRNTEQLIADNHFANSSLIDDIEHNRLTWKADELDIHAMILAGQIDATELKQAATMHKIQCYKLWIECEMMYENEEHKSIDDGTFEPVKIGEFPTMEDAQRYAETLEQIATYDQQEKAKANYIVCYSTVMSGEQSGNLQDHFTVFLHEEYDGKAEEAATAFYDQIRQRSDLFTADLCKMVKSTESSYF
jgi:hypothetical protein